MANYSDLKLDLLDELCDKLDDSGIEGNVIERDSHGRPYVNIWYGSFNDHCWRLPEMFTVLVTDYSFSHNPSGCYEIKPPEKYQDYFKDTFIACRSRTAGFYVMGSDQIVRTIKFLFNRENLFNREKMKKENKMEKKQMYKVVSYDIENKISTMTSYNGQIDIRVTADRVLTDADALIIKQKIEEVNRIDPYSAFMLAARGNGKIMATKMLLNSLYGSIATGNWMGIEDVIFNDPATIIIWADGTKTVVKAENEKFDPEKGLAMAISKKVLGNKHNYYEVFKKYVGRYQKKQAKKAKK